LGYQLDVPNLGYHSSEIGRRETHQAYNERLVAQDNRGTTIGITVGGDVG
jgi:hypothetical protein